jgi:hypothetical protein
MGLGLQGSETEVNSRFPEVALRQEAMGQAACDFIFVSFVAVPNIPSHFPFTPVSPHPSPTTAFGKTNMPPQYAQMSVRPPSKYDNHMRHPTITVRNKTKMCTWVFPDLAAPLSVPSL